MNEHQLLRRVKKMGYFIAFCYYSWFFLQKKTFSKQVRWQRFESSELVQRKLTYRYMNVCQFASEATTRTESSGFLCVNRIFERTLQVAHIQSDILSLETFRVL